MNQGQDPLLLERYPTKSSASPSLIELARYFPIVSHDHVNKYDQGAS